MYPANAYVIRQATEADATTLADPFERSLPERLRAAFGPFVAAQAARG
jgi:hypothetical protein